MVTAKLSLKSLARRLVRRLEERGIAVEALYLFGSHARGQAALESDIDVLLVSPTLATQPFWARCARVGEALGDLAEPVQVYPVTRSELHEPEPGGFLASIRADLQLLYERSKGRRMGTRS